MKKIYFASDFHFGIPDRESSEKREKLFVNWLDEIKADAAEIYLMGDLFDFWYEYKSVIPKGYVRLLGKLAEVRDSGIRIHLFRGNHDVWAFSYLEEEIGIELHREPLKQKMGEKMFYLAHGDGLGPGDNGYKMLKKVFENSFAQWLFRWIHPDIGSGLALYFSKKSRMANIAKEGSRPVVHDLSKEMLYNYSTELYKSQPDINFFVFGHRHIPMNIKLSEECNCIIIGDWITHFTYAVFDGREMVLKRFVNEGNDSGIIQISQPAQ